MTGDQIDFLLKALAIGAGPTISLVIFSNSGGTKRARLKTDAEILGNLEKGSRSHKEMAELVEEEVIGLREHERGERQFGWTLFAAAGSSGLGYLTYWLAEMGGLWWIGAATAGFLGIVFLFGIFDSVAKLERDSEGKTIKASPKRIEDDDA